MEKNAIEINCFFIYNKRDRIFWKGLICYEKNFVDDHISIFNFGFLLTGK